MVLVLFHVPTVPVGVEFESVVTTCFETNELVGTPACSGLEAGVVGGGPEACTLCRSYLVSLILCSVNEREAAHVVSSLVGERTILCEEGVCLIKADNDSVFCVDGVDTNGIPFYLITVTGDVEQSFFEEFFLSSLIKIAPVKTEGKQSVSYQFLSNSEVFLGDQGVAVLVSTTCDSLQSSLSFSSTNIVVDKGIQRIASQGHAGGGGIQVNLSCVDIADIIRVVRGIILTVSGNDGSIDRSAREEVIARALEHKGIVESITTEVHECRIQLSLHRVYKVSSNDGCAVVPLQVVTKGDLPSVAAFSDLLSGVAPLSVNGCGNVFELSSCGIVSGVSTLNDACLVDGTVCVVLAAFELVVIVEEGRTNVAHNLSIIVVCIGQFIPVRGHNTGGSVVLCLLEFSRNDYIGCVVAAFGSSGGGFSGSGRNSGNACSGCAFVLLSAEATGKHNSYQYQTRCHDKHGSEFSVHNVSSIL